jgi:hypothetical protein
MQAHKNLLWTGRIGGLVITLLFLAFFIGKGIPDISASKGGGLIHFLPILSVSFVGYFLAWLKPKSGGWVLLAGATITAGYCLLVGDGWMALAYGLPALLIGLCFLEASNKELI